MADTSIDYSQIQLKENIPLSEEELNRIAIQKRDFFKDTPGILLAAIIVIALIASFVLKDEFTNFKFYHYITGISILLVFYSFCYCIIWGIYKYSTKNWEKDIKDGKNKLTSIITYRHKTENDEYIITFAGRHKHEKIKLPVEKAYYDRYPKGTKVIVTYLKYSKVVLTLNENP
ncbi:hypothetical protein [Chryseobacterium populi]|uniref:Uncharacterized protein n=1 Tax=Chryseobacterium populi TaxID=1144316 RepID=J2SR12_9FLAO|nr:hypothetical protein [Chryseobacterium populi]EJL67997.1 hypothetical protein PMI13_03955 [Chryseobacterium populi]